MADAQKADSPPADEKYVIDGVEYSVHRLAQMFPLIKGPEYDSFLEDVARRGVARPVLRRGTEIIDGRNRVRAALDAGKKIPFVELGAAEHPAEAIMSANIHVRVLTASQRTVFATRLREAAPEVFERHPKVPPPTAKAVTPAGKGPGAPGPAPAGPSPGSASGKPSGDASPRPAVPDHERRREAAKQAGVSDVYQRQSETVKREAPELFAAVGDGDLSVRDAYAIRAEEPELRAKALEDVRQGRAKTAAEAVETHTGRAPKAQPPAQRRKASAAAPDSSLPPLPKVGSGGGPSAPAATGSAKTPAPAPAPAKSSPRAAPGPATPAAPAARTGSPAPAAPAAPAPPPPASPVARSSAAGPHPDMLTPSFLLAGLRLILGDIDLDPCSTADAQDHIAAGEWYTADQDGLRQPWKGSVWVFPPLDLAAAFAERLLSELRSASVGPAALLVPADLSPEWAQKLVHHSTFSGLVLETERNLYEVAGGSPGVRCPPMAVYLFGTNAPPAKYVESVGLWGRVLLTVPDQRG